MRIVTVFVVVLSVTVFTGACQKTSPPDHEHGPVSTTAPGADHTAPDQSRTVPPAVAAALERQSPGARITKFHTHTHPGEPERWHLHYVTADGKEEEASFDSTGQPAAE
jgi:hypothetical protein